jgi:hypothetical protein
MIGDDDNYRVSQLSRMTDSLSGIRGEDTAVDPINRLIVEKMTSAGVLKGDKSDSDARIARMLLNAKDEYLSPYFGGSAAAMMRGTLDATNRGGFMVGGDRIYSASPVSDQVSGEIYKSLMEHFFDSRGAAIGYRGHGFDRTEIGAATQLLGRSGAFRGIDVGELDDNGNLKSSSKEFGDAKNKVNSIVQDALKVASEVDSLFDEELGMGQIFKIISEIGGGNAGSKGVRDRARAAVRRLQAEARATGGDAEQAVKNAQAMIVRLNQANPGQESLNASLGLAAANTGTMMKFSAERVLPKGLEMDEKKAEMHGAAVAASNAETYKRFAFLRYQELHASSSEQREAAVAAIKLIHSGGPASEIHRLAQASGALAQMEASGGDTATVLYDPKVAKLAAKDVAMEHEASVAQQGRNTVRQLATASESDPAQRAYKNRILDIEEQLKLGTSVLNPLLLATSPEAFDTVANDWFERNGAMDNEANRRRMEELKQLRLVTSGQSLEAITLGGKRAALAGYPVIGVDDRSALDEQKLRTMLIDRHKNPNTMTSQVQAGLLGSKPQLSDSEVFQFAIQSEENQGKFKRIDSVAAMEQIMVEQFKHEGMTDEEADSAARKWMEEKKFSELKHVKPADVARFMEENEGKLRTAGAEVSAREEMDAALTWEEAERAVYNAHVANGANRAEASKKAKESIAASKKNAAERTGLQGSQEEPEFDVEAKDMIVKENEDTFTNAGDHAVPLVVHEQDAVKMEEVVNAKSKTLYDARNAIKIAYGDRAKDAFAIDPKGDLNTQDGSKKIDPISHMLDDKFVSDVSNAFDVELANFTSGKIADDKVFGAKDDHADRFQVDKYESIISALTALGPEGEKQAAVLRERVLGGIATAAGNAKDSTAQHHLKTFAKKIGGEAAETNIARNMPAVEVKSAEQAAKERAQGTGGEAVKGDSVTGSGGEVVKGPPATGGEGKTKATKTPRGSTDVASGSNTVHILEGKITIEDDRTGRIRIKTDAIEGAA